MNKTHSDKENEIISPFGCFNRTIISVTLLDEDGADSPSQLLPPELYAMKNFSLPKLLPVNKIPLSLPCVTLPSKAILVSRLPKAWSAQMTSPGYPK